MFIAASLLAPTIRCQTQPAQRSAHELMLRDSIVIRANVVDVVVDYPAVGRFVHLHRSVG